MENHWRIKNKLWRNTKRSVSFGYFFIKFIKDSLIFVNNAAREEGNKDGVNIDKDEFDKVSAKQKELDEIQDENILLAEQSADDEDENE